MMAPSEGIIDHDDVRKTQERDAIAKAREEHKEELHQLYAQHVEEKAELEKKYRAAHENLLVAQMKHLNEVARPFVSERRQLNAAQSISILPVEMLGEVFQQLMLSCLQSDPITYGWVPVTQVCFHWRSVAFAKLSLWRYVHIHIPRAGFVLERALKARSLIEFHDLQLTGTWYKPRVKHLTEVLFRDHPHRIRLIDIKAKWLEAHFRPDRSPLDTPLTSSGLTALVDVRLDLRLEPWYPSDVWLTWISHLPSLKYLELEKGVCSEASLLGQDFTFPGTLEVLKFRFHRIDRQESSMKLDHNPLIRSLQHCSGVQSRLRSLTLSGEGLFADRQPIHTLDLPQLDYLSITDDAPSCERILRSIIAPPGLRLCMHAIFAKDKFTVEQAMQRLSSALLDKQAINPCIKSILRLHIVGIADSVTITGFNSLDPSNDEPTFSVGVSFTLSTSWKSCYVGKFIRQYYPSLNLAAVQTLYLDCDCRPPLGDYLIDALSESSSMSTISTVEVLQFMQHSILPRVLGVNMTKDLLFPMLTHIKISNDIRPRSKGSGMNAHKADFEQSCTELRNALYARSQNSTSKPLFLEIQKLQFIVPGWRTYAIIKSLATDDSNKRLRTWIASTDKRSNLASNYQYDTGDEETIVELAKKIYGTPMSDELSWTLFHSMDASMDSPDSSGWHRPSPEEYEPMEM